MILDFQMHKITTVEMIGRGLWRVISRWDDALFSADVVFEVKTPSLDIRRAELTVHRDVPGLTPDLASLCRDLVGVRIGQGMTKIVRSLLGGPAGSDAVAELVIEAMELLVNALTVPELRKATQQGGVALRAPQDGPEVYLNDVVIGEDTARQMAANPRLKDSCAAFRGLE